MKCIIVKNEDKKDTRLFNIDKIQLEFQIKTRFLAFH